MGRPTLRFWPQHCCTTFGNLTAWLGLWFSCCLLNLWGYTHQQAATPHNLFCVLLIREEHNDILAVADWGQKLSFYQLSGKQVCSSVQTQWEAELWSRLLRLFSLSEIVLLVILRYRGQLFSLAPPVTPGTQCCAHFASLFLTKPYEVSTLSVF